MRVLLVLLFAALIGASVPTAAQSSPYIESRVLWTPGSTNQTEVELDASGRGDAGTRVGFRVVGSVTCASTARYSLEVIITNSPPGWAGASLATEQQRRVEFSLAAGSHSGTQAWSEKAGPTLGIFWDTETAPSRAEVEYVVRVEHARLVPESSDCSPALASRDQLHHNATLRALGPETFVDSTDGVDPTTGGGSPGAGIVLVLGGVAVAAAVRCRRR